MGVSDEVKTKCLLLDILIEEWLEDPNKGWCVWKTAYWDLWCYKESGDVKLYTTPEKALEGYLSGDGVWD